LTLTHSKFALVIEPKPRKVLEKLDKQIQSRIFSALKLLETNPRPKKATQMVGFEYLWRIRVGDYRVIYTVRDQELVILVVSIGHRKDVYRNLN
jgi:mRNA interferase RelE/StbE